MAILDTVVRTHIPFDAGNSEHRAIYWKLRTYGRQDADIRFVLEEGFSSIMTMMQTKIADHYSRPPKAKVNQFAAIPVRMREWSAK